MTRHHTRPAPTDDQRGLALVSVAVIMTVVLVLATSLIQAVLSNRLATKSLEADYFAVQIAEAGIEKAIFCLNATSGSDCAGSFGTSYTGETDVIFGGGSFSTTVAVSGSGGTISGIGVSPTGKVATITSQLTTLPPADDIDFSYALQAGGSGAYLENNAEIQGTIYAGGDVECQSPIAVVDGDIWVSKIGGKIDSCGVNYHAHADNILNTDVVGDVYYDEDPAGIAGTTYGGNAYPGSTTPTEESLPDMDLDFWRDAAFAGGVYTGDYTPTDGETLGPLKIDGDLILLQNRTLNIAGPLWVTGNITTNNNVTFQLDPEFGDDSTVILADDPLDIDGKITLEANVDIIGTGSPVSHILFASTSSSLDETDAAINVLNNASGAIFFAVNGVLRLHNNAGAKSLAGGKLWLDQNATVTYIESELAGMNFSNSPGGKWRVLEGTWARK